MEITKFRKLLHAVNELGATQSIVRLLKELETEGVDVDPGNLIFGKGGIYHISKENTVSTVILHIVDKKIIERYFPQSARDALDIKDYDSINLVEKIHRYHFLNCQKLQEAQRNGWHGKFKVSKRTDGRFTYRFIENNTVLVENNNQKLKTCMFCLRLFNEFDDVSDAFTPDTFFPKDFFELELQNRWLSESGAVIDEAALPDIYRHDWREISKKYRDSVNYQCEGSSCRHPDLSHAQVQKYLHCHHVSGEKNNNRYSNLKALCILCHAEQANHSHIRNLPDYKRYSTYVSHKRRAH